MPRQFRSALAAHSLIPMCAPFELIDSKRPVGYCLVLGLILSPPTSLISSFLKKTEGIASNPKDPSFRRSDNDPRNIFWIVRFQIRAVSFRITV